MPGWPTPLKPVLHHEPGHLSKASSYTTQVSRLNAEGLEETIQLSGMDAMAADGVDPFSGNYTMVSYDQLMRGGWANNNLSLETMAVSDTLAVIPVSHLDVGNYPYNDIASGDLNNDGQAEQIAAWLDEDLTLNISTGEVPGLPGRTTSAPAAVARGGDSGGYALQFDGFDDYVNTGSGISLANTSFTVAFWARRFSASTWDLAVGQGAGSINQGLYIGFRDSNIFTCAFWNNDLNMPQVYTDPDWHYWACTYDADTNLRKIYQDGVQVAQGLALADYQGSGDLHIGWAFNATFSFDGLIDDVGIWNAARTQEQINLDLFRTAPDELNLAAYWPFEEGAGTATADISGNGHDGTLVNGPLWNPEIAPEGELHLLVRGYDEALWQCNYDIDSGGCLRWNNLGGGLLLSAPAAVSRGEDQFDVFAVGTNYQVYMRQWDSGWIGSWQQYGDWPYPAMSWAGPTPEVPAPAVVARNGGIDLFRLGPDNTLLWHDGAGWQSLGGMLASGPGAVSLSENHMQVFARGMDDSLWTIGYSGGWGDWQRLPLDGVPAGVTMASAPAAVTPGADQMVVYVRGSDNQTWSIEYEGGVWSNWSVAGGVLASGLGAVVWSGATYLFAQKFDDQLQSSLDELTWADVGGLPPSFMTLDTGFTAQTRNIGVYQDFSVDIETGYFLGDGRSQIALAYYFDALHIRIAIYESGERFQPQCVTDVDVNGDIETLRVNAFSIAAGDFLGGDGIDDIALTYTIGKYYNLQVIQVTREGLSTQVTGTVEEVIIPDEDGNYMDGNFTGTIDLAAGDFDQDGRDEIGLATVWHREDWIYLEECDSHIFSVRMRIYDLLEDLVSGDYNLRMYYADGVAGGVWGAWWGEAIYDEPDPDREAYIIGINIAAGDVNGDGKDELVRTWPYEFSNYADSCADQDEPVTSRFVRALQVLELPDNPDGYTNDWCPNGNCLITGGTVTTVDLGVWTFSYQDRLVVGDLNRDTIGEFAWQMSDWLRTYYLDPDADPSRPYQPFTAWYLLSPRVYPEMAVGAFTGESVRVGPPSYRVQNRIDTPVAMINMPPVHRDIVKDDGGNNIVFETPQETCIPSIDNPECTHAKYRHLNFSESEELIETKHEYSISAGMENKTCAGGGLPGLFDLKACLKTSIDYTHGGQFDSTTDNISSITYNQKVIAADDDKIIYFGTPYAVWEYPVLTDEPGATPGYITVVSPLIKQTSYPSSLGGYYNPSCDEDWYAAGHQPDNVWSYDPIGDVRFTDYDPDRVVYDPGTLDDWFEEEITYETFQQTTDSTTFSHSIKAGLGLETSGSANIKMITFEGDFKAYIKGSYDYSRMETDRFTTKEGTTYSFFLSPKPLDAKYSTRPILYWANAGYMVMDYQAEPGQGARWLLYDKPDPAFILAWYGFPDPAAPENPPCGEAKKLFSKDVVIDPQVVSVGDTVTITAVVRNFSSVIPPASVTVRFYLGDPSLNVVIG